MVLRVVPMEQGLDEFLAVQLIIVVRIVHLKVVELELLLTHPTGVQGHVQMVLNMSPFIVQILVVKHLLPTRLKKKQYFLTKKQFISSNETRSSHSQKRTNEAEHKNI